MINEIGINKIVVPNKSPFGEQDFKYFIGYKGNKKIKPLCIFFPETNVYRIDLDKTEYMSFLMKDKEFSEKYKQIFEKVSNMVKKIIVKLFMIKNI